MRLFPTGAMKGVKDEIVAVQFGRLGIANQFVCVCGICTKTKGWHDGMDNFAAATKIYTKSDAAEILSIYY